MHGGGSTRKGKPWWAEVANISIAPYPTRDEALAAEREAILSEGPKYNVLHKPGVIGPVERELMEAGEALAAAEEARQAAMERIKAALIAGDGQVPIKEMAERGGVSRVTAYRLLGRDVAPYRPRKRGGAS